MQRLKPELSVKWKSNPAEKRKNASKKSRKNREPIHRRRLLCRNERRLTRLNLFLLMLVAMR